MYLTSGGGGMAGDTVRCTVCHCHVTIMHGDSKMEYTYVQMKTIATTSTRESVLQTVL